MKKLLLSVAIVAFSLSAANAQLLKNDFLNGRSVGENVEQFATYNGTSQSSADNPINANAWNRSGNTTKQSGDSPKIVTALSYTGYIESGKVGSIDIVPLAASEERYTIYSLANNNTTYPGGTYYLVFMFKVDAFAGTGTYDFICFDANYTGNTMRGRFGVKDIDGTSFQVGIGNGSTPADLTGALDITQTHLAVMKLVIDGAGAVSVSYVVNPAISSTEPAFSTPIDGTGLSGIRGITLRSREQLSVKVGGLRLADTWENAIGYTSGINGTDTDSKEVASSKYFDLTGKEVLNPAKGLYVKKVIYTDGTTNSDKVIF